MNTIAKKISDYVIIKREYDDFKNERVYRAYFRGTNNRVRELNNDIVKGYFRKADLIRKLLNSAMERGVISYY